MRQLFTSTRPSQASKSVSVPKARQMAPRREAGLLGGIARVGLVADDRPGRPEQPVDARRDERLEGGDIARPGAFDQPGIGCARGHRAGRVQGHRTQRLRLLTPDTMPRPGHGFVESAHGDPHCLHAMIGPMNVRGGVQATGDDVTER